MRASVSLGSLSTFAPVAACAVLLAVPARGDVAATPSPAPVTIALCTALEAAAKRNDLPTAFFVRLIWQESRFDPSARSHAGAEGVAQFMPGTAAERGLADPFEPARALDESAAYLTELRQKFGNLGLAAAAYNAGPGRVGRWLAGASGLPAETEGYVRIVTGRDALDWRGPAPAALTPEPGFTCLGFAGAAGRRRAPAASDDPSGPPPKPWAVIIVGSFNKAAVLAEWQIVRARYAETLGPLTPSIRRRHLGGMPAKKYVVQIEADTRSASTSLCKRLEGNGGTCVVLRNLLR